MVRVLLVAHGYPPETLGGAEAHTAILARALAARRHDVRVFAGRAGVRADLPSVVEEVDGAVAVHRVARGGEVGRLVDPGVRAQFERLLDDAAPEVVHVQHLLHLSADLIEAAGARGIPTVVTLHDFWFQCPAIHPGPRDWHHDSDRLWGMACAWHLLRRPRRAASLAIHGNLVRAVASTLRRSTILRHHLARADLILAPSRYVLEAFARFGIPPERIHVAPHGTHVSRVRRRTMHDPIRFGFVGRVAREKGVHVLCDAFSGLGGRSTLDLLGPARDSRYFERIARSLGPRIRYRGEFRPEEAASVYEELDVLVIPSLVGESFGLTAAEAHASGLPVIASRVGALPERVSEGRGGILVPPGDVGALGRALHVLQDPAEVRRMAAEIRAPRSMTSYVDEIERIYSDLVSGRATDPSAGGAAAARRCLPVGERLRHGFGGPG